MTPARPSTSRPARASVARHPLLSAWRIMSRFPSLGAALASPPHDAGEREALVLLGMVAARVVTPGEAAEGADAAWLAAGHRSGASQQDAADTLREGFVEGARRWCGALAHAA